MSELPKAYEPSEVETRWYQFWVEQGVFRAGTSPDDPRPVYSVTLPPPNVTGSLHMGHALMGTIQDVLVRHKRMQGFNVLWQPGTDHAGIATQTVVERQLKRENLSRHDLGREAFLERVWQWKEQSGNRIMTQLQGLGCSMDYDRHVFTMDPDLCDSVREAFVRLHEDGLIYRATRLINWDWESLTALSDLEVENEEAIGELYEFAYEVVDADAGGPKELVVATTRPETMLGDTAVAVHSKDERYLSLHGKMLKHPFCDRLVPVVTDDILVDPEFGTGAVKVTPAHDFNDFATGKRHNLEEISILNLDGKVNEHGGKFEGLSVLEARKAVKAALEELGLERGSKPHKLQLPKSQRSGVVVEPMISTQWFMRMEPLAKEALAAVKDGRTQILPAEWEKTYSHWLSNIQDWCLSRQLWWGHRIPAFHCGACGEITVTREDTVDACPKCGSHDIKQDEDVLDTWFSSALWPFTTLGWPKQSTELERFYPTSDLETGYDILFFWVARMMMMGLHFMGDVPFKRILLHGLVVDETGEKMSKVKGNTIDPIDLIRGADFDQIIDKALPGAPRAEALKKFKSAYPSTAKMEEGFPAFGADALRFTLSRYSPQAKRIALSPQRIEGYRHFCNKIYNATRFALMHIEGLEVPEQLPEPKLAINRWILSRLGEAVSQATTGIDEFRIDEGAQALYAFFWDEFCGWYLELTKPIMQKGSAEEIAETKLVLAHTLENALRALHPYMPYLTEELWQRVPRPASRPATIALASYPTRADGPENAEIEYLVGALCKTISAIRTVRSEHEIHPSAGISAELRTADAKIRTFLEEHSREIIALAKTDGAPKISEPKGERPRAWVLSVAGAVEVLIDLKGHVDPAKETERIERNLKKIQKDADGLLKRLNNPSFMERAPEEVVTEARATLANLELQQQRLEGAKLLVAELSEG